MAKKIHFNVLSECCDPEKAYYSSDPAAIKSANFNNFDNVFYLQ